MNQKSGEKPQNILTFCKESDIIVMNHILAEECGSKKNKKGVNHSLPEVPSPNIMSSTSCVGESLLNPGCLRLNCQ